jgi:hypothetical protein
VGVTPAVRPPADRPGVTTSGDLSASEVADMTRASPRDPIDVAVGARMPARRGALRMSQTDVGEAPDVTFQQVQKYERGDNRASASTLARVGRALSVSVASLLGEADPSAMIVPRFRAWRPAPATNSWTPTRPSRTFGCAGRWFASPGRWRTG